MTRKILLLAALITFTISSCTEESNKQESQAAQKNQNGTTKTEEVDESLENAKVQEAIPEENEVVTRGKKREERKLQHDPKLAKKNNHTSPYTYLKTTEGYNIISNFISQSGLAKTLHNDKITIFAPKDEFFKQDIALKLKGFVRDNEIGKLDQYLGKYMIHDNAVASKIHKEGDMMSIASTPINFSEDGGMVNGIEYSMQDIFTNSGGVIELHGCFPF